MGHWFGATDTYPHVVGGIMDYRTPLINGTYQFHPYSESEVCPQKKCHLKF